MCCGTLASVPYLLDLAVVTVFVLTGRATHDDGVLSTGSLHALWPFLLALGVAWLAIRPLALPLTGLRAGGLIWLVTLLGGIGLRALSGQGTALPFLVVATLVLAVGLLGWRGVATLLARKTHLPCHSMSSRSRPLFSGTNLWTIKNDSRAKRV